MYPVNESAVRLGQAIKARGDVAFARAEATAHTEGRAVSMMDYRRELTAVHDALGPLPEVVFS